MTHVHVMYEYGIDNAPHCTAYIRLLNPLGHPAAAHRIKLTSGRVFEPADVVVVDRTWKCDATLSEVEELIGAARKHGTRLLYHLDDNLLDLDLSSGFRHGLSLVQQAYIRLLARESDGLILSTANLAERMAKFNDCIYVIPNALDERMFPPRDPGFRPKRSGKIKVGYMGTFTHDEDFYMILEALRHFSDQIEFEIVGVVSDPRLIEVCRPLAVAVRDTGGMHAYPDFIRWMTTQIQWDIGIAPLEESLFTRCKSDIKFLDYSMIRIPGIYSSVPAYENTVRHLETGVLSENSIGSWYEKLEILIKNPELRHSMADSAETWARENRTLAVCADQWIRAMEG